MSVTKKVDMFLKMAKALKGEGLDGLKKRALDPNQGGKPMSTSKEYSGMEVGVETPKLQVSRAVGKATKMLDNNKFSEKLKTQSGLIGDILRQLHKDIKPGGRVPDSDFNPEWSSYLNGLMMTINQTKKQYNLNTDDDVLLTDMYKLFSDCWDNIVKDGRWKASSPKVVLYQKRARFESINRSNEGQKELVLKSLEELKSCQVPRQESGGQVGLDMLLNQLKVMSLYGDNKKPKDWSESFSYTADEIQNVLNGNMSDSDRKMLTDMKAKFRQFQYEDAAKSEA